MSKDKKSLAETHPEVAKQWHPTKNGDLTPYDVTKGMNKKDVAKFCKSLGASQNDIGKAIKTSQQYVAKLLR